MPCTLPETSHKETEYFVFESTVIQEKAFIQRIRQSFFQVLPGAHSFKLYILHTYTYMFYILNKQRLSS